MKISESLIQQNPVYKKIFDESEAIRVALGAATIAEALEIYSKTEQSKFSEVDSV